MKKLLLFGIAFSLVLTSCKKDDETKPVTPTPTPVATTPTYTPSGTLPTWGTNSDGMLVGTKWVITKVVSGFSTTYPNDTIEFVSNTEYTINSGAVKTYNLTTSVASTNKTLNLYYFFPFGSGHHSGEISGQAVSDGEMNNTEFMNVQNSTDKIKSWWVLLP